MSNLLDISLLTSSFGTLVYSQLQFYLSQKYLSKVYVVDRVQNYDVDYIEDLSIIPTGKHVAIRCIMPETINLYKNAYWLNMYDPILYSVLNKDLESGKEIKTNEEIVLQPKVFPVKINIKNKIQEFEADFESIELAHKSFGLIDKTDQINYSDLTGKITRGQKYILLGAFDHNRIYKVKYVTSKNKESLLIALDQKAFAYKQRCVLFMGLSMGILGSAFIFRKLS